MLLLCFVSSFQLYSNCLYQWNPYFLLIDCIKLGWKLCQSNILIALNKGLFVASAVWPSQLAQDAALCLSYSGLEEGWCRFLSCSCAPRKGGSKVRAASALRGFCLAVTCSSWAHLPVTEHVALPRPSSHRPGSVLPSAGKADWNSWRIFLTTAGFTMGSSPGNPPSLHLPPLSPSLLSFSSLLPSFDL